MFFAIREGVRWTYIAFGETEEEARENLIRAVKKYWNGTISKEDKEDIMEETHCEEIKPGKCYVNDGTWH